MNRIYSIATNRELIKEYLYSYVDEIKQIQEQANAEVPLVIIDESDSKIQKYNKELLESISDKEVRFYNFNSDMQYRLFEYLKSNLKNDKLIDLLDYSGFSYARAMNKQFLAANVLHAECIHRRDSDVKILPHEFGYPGKIETEYLGKKVSEIKNIDEKLTHKDDQIIYMVGSGYSGGSDWKADFGAFKENDVDLIKEVAQLFDYGKELSEEYLSEIISGNVNIHNDIRILPYRNHPNPICGNISFYKIFNFLPCGTHMDTIGSDNLIREFLKEIHSPIIYHTNFVYHKFDPTRNNNDISYLSKYWPRVINKLIYYKSIRKIILEGAQQKYSYISDIEKIDFSNVINNDLVNKKYLKEICDESVTNFLNIFCKAKNNKITTLYNLLNTSEFYEATLENVYNGLINGNTLINNWNDILSVCSSFNI